MAQRESEYARQELDAYFTPEWVTLLLCQAEDFRDVIWEPACGEGHMSQALKKFTGNTVCSTDIAPHGYGSEADFFYCSCDFRRFDIVTNPPFRNAQSFIERALELTERHKGKVAMLLPFNFDAAKGRRHLFKDHPAFKAKHALTRRIRWVNLEQKKNGPSTNHAWFVWDWKNEQPPVASYLFFEAAE